MSKIDEKELEKLFTQLKSSNNRNVVFETLYSKYNRLVYKIAFTILKNKEDSEDIVQTVFSKIYTMSTDKLPLQNISSWIYSVTKNESISLFRKKKNTIDIDSIYEITDNDNEINNIIDQIEFNKLISRLNDKEKEIVSLKVLTNLSFDEIAKLLNEPTGTAKWRYYKSIHTLKILLSNLGMFIVTFAIGVKTLFNKDRIMQDNSNVEEQVIDNDKVEQNTSDNREESKSQDIEEDTNEELKDITNNVEESETKQETLIPDSNSQTNINYYGIGILSISAIFLIIAIIFSIFLVKHQLNLKKKTSK